MEKFDFFFIVFFVKDVTLKQKKYFCVKNTKI